MVLLTNRSQKLLLLKRALAPLSLLPIGVATARDLHYATQSGDPMLPGLLLDELVSYYGRDTAGKFAAFIVKGRLSTCSEMGSRD